MKKIVFIFTLISLFTECKQPQYCATLKDTKKTFRFSKMDTISIKGGVIALMQTKLFVSYHKAKNHQFIDLGNPVDSFTYSINSFAYYLAPSNVNNGLGILRSPEQKQEYLKLNETTYKIFVVDSSQICLQPLKKAVAIATAFEPLFRLPPLEIEGIDKTPFNLKELIGKNKYTLISVWATWCQPCMESLPQLDRLALDYKENLQVVSLNYKEAYPHFSKWVTSPNTLYGKIGDKEYQKLNVAGMPYYALFNRNGELISYHLSIKDANWITLKLK
jgi:thiol-disulfide isomerase/thioredoxin